MDCPNLVANARHLSPMRAKLLVLKQGLRGMMHEPVSLVGAWLKRVAEGYCRRHAVPGSVCLQHRHARLQGTHHPAIAGGKSTAPVYCRHLSCREPLQDSGFRARVPNLLRASNPLTTGSPGFTYGSLAPQPKPPRKPRLRTVRHPSETEEFLPSIYKGPEAVKTISRRDLHSASDHRPKSLIFRRLAPLSSCVFPPKERS
jgi:hypothetical protein